MHIGILIIGDEILSGRRLDKHLAHVIGTLKKRNLELAWVRYVGDDENNLIQDFREILSRGDVCFSFGGIGATPDDRTRQAIAAACEVPIERHAEAVREIETQFSEAAYPNRILMADLPQGSTLIPNPLNRIPGFSLAHIHCLPGFPEMAWPMLEWVLETLYSDLKGQKHVLFTLKVKGAHESELLDLMRSIQTALPQIKLSSLPRFLPDGEREIEFGVQGNKQAATYAFETLKQALSECKLTIHIECAP